MVSDSVKVRVLDFAMFLLAHAKVQIYFLDCRVFPGDDVKHVI